MARVPYSSFDIPLAKAREETGWRLGVAGSGSRFRLRTRGYGNAGFHVEGRSSYSWCSNSL
jgi:hypothetical protein